MLATVWCIRNFDQRQNLLFSRIGSIFLVITVVIFSAIKIYFNRFNLLIDLPISLCNLFAILAPLLFWHPNQRRLEVIYFLVMAGTLQAMLTPDLYVGFPSNEFFKYWIVHGGLVVLVIHNIFAFQMYPRLKGIVITFAWVNVYSAALYGLNLLMDANYFIWCTSQAMHRFSICSDPGRCIYWWPNWWPWFSLRCFICHLCSSTKLSSRSRRKNRQAQLKPLQFW